MVEREQYIFPTKDELNFEGRINVIEQFTSLLEKQIQGIELGIRPNFPRGMSESLKATWRERVWDKWIKYRKLRKDDLLPEGNEFHSKNRNFYR